MRAACRHSDRWLIVAVLSGPHCGGAGSARRAGNVVTITIDGTPQNVLFLSPATKPVAAVVMFPGGDGQIGIGANGSIARQGNFLIRTRDKWLARGFLFVAVDAAAARAVPTATGSGPPINAPSPKSSAPCVSRTPAPIWLLGTSAGAPAAVAGAASLPAGIDQGRGRSVRRSRCRVMHDSVFDAPLARVSVPVLIQIHEQDGCSSTPPANAARIKAALTSAPVVEVQQFSGGTPPRSTLRGVRATWVPRHRGSGGHRRGELDRGALTRRLNA